MCGFPHPLSLVLRFDFVIISHQCLPRKRRCKYSFVLPLTIEEKKSIAVHLYYSSNIPFLANLFTQALPQTLTLTVTQQLGYSIRESFHAGMLLTANQTKVSHPMLYETMIKIPNISRNEISEYPTALII